MPRSTLTLNGQRFIVLPESEYLSLKAQAAGKSATKRREKSRSTAAVETDAGDIREATKRLANPKRVPADELFRRLLAEDLDRLRAEVDVGVAEADRGEFVEFSADDVISERKAARFATIKKNVRRPR